MNIIALVNELMQSGETFCLATVVASDHPDIPAGRKAVVREDGSMQGEIGGIAALNRGIRQAARTAMDDNKSRTLEIDRGLRVFFNVLSPQPTLIVCGAGHIAVPLARFARETGFCVTVLDDRADFANAVRFPGCSVVVDEFTPVLAKMKLGKSAYVIVITRGHEHDADCLLEVLKKETAYVGLIGSRRRVSFVLQMIGRQGIAPGRIKDVFSPIGIPIGAESPVEIALSIIAELVCVRRKGSAQARALRAAIGIDRNDA
jgi:xanthine dehydrogenase accessory factor